MSLDKFEGAQIRRAKHEKDFVVIHRHTAQDRNISFEARGMLLYLLSKPDDWSIQVADLAQQCQKGRVYRILKDLIEAGYIENRERKQLPNGKFEWTPYILHERPITNIVPFPEKPEMVLPDMENTDILVNTEVQNKEEKNTSPLADEPRTDGNTQQAKKSKPATPNDPLFNWVAWNCFDLDPFAEIHKPELKRNSGRIGKIKAYLLEKAATIEQLDRFKAYYAHNMAGYSMPKDDAKFSVHFKKFLDNSKPVGVANIDPPKRPSVRDFVVFEKPEGKKAAGE
jgi:hypothetical protein